MNDIEARGKIKKAHNVISLVNKEAYKDIFLLSNQLLSKSPFNSRFFNRCLNEQELKGLPVYKIGFKLVTYYFKSLLHFLMFILRFFEYKFSILRFHPSENHKELIIIDESFIMEKIEKRGLFEDLFFPGLKAVLEKRDKHYAYLPFFYSASYHKKPLEFYRVLKILKKQKVPVISEYQLFNLADLLKLLYFIFAYPFHVLKLSNSLQLGSKESKLVKYELLDTLDDVTFYNFLRFLVGEGILRLPYPGFKIISWYENQPIQKNLYRGLRREALRVKIYGAQLFLWPQDLLYMRPDENENDFGVIPDWIIANGPFYFPKNSRFSYRIGPSLRSRGIFRTTIRRENQKNIIVFLPFFKDDTENILQAISDTKLSSQNILLKAHPAVPLDGYRHSIPHYMTITNEDIYKLFETAKLVVSASSSILLEASSLGIPVISIKNNKPFDFYNPLPEYGRGIIWEEVANSEELMSQIDKFNCALEENSEEINKIADAYRVMFFCEISDEKIISAFDL